MSKLSLQQLKERLQGQVNVQSSEQLHRHHGSGIVLAEGNSRVHLIERSLLRQRTFSILGATGSKWWDALRIQLDTWTPFEQTDYVVVKSGQSATVWAWDKIAFARRCEQNNLKTRNIRVVPESMLFLSQNEGVQLCACHHGFEAQFWLDGRLNASRYWPVKPNATDWLNFQRGVKLPLKLHQPQLPTPDTIQEPERLPDILPKIFNPEAAQNVQDKLKPLLVVAGAFLMISFTAIAVIDRYHYQQALEQKKIQRQQLQEEAAPILAALDKAIKDKATIETLQRIIMKPEPLELLAHVSMLLQDSGSQVNRLEWSQGALQIALSTPADGQRADLIRKLEQSPWLDSVREVTSSTSADVQLRAQTLPLAEVGPLPVTDAGAGKSQVTQGDSP